MFRCQICEKVTSPREKQFKVAVSEKLLGGKSKIIGELNVCEQCKDGGKEDAK